MSEAVSIEARIGQILSTALHLEIPSVDLDLFETGAIDSLGFVEFLLHLEREFGLSVSLEQLDLDNFRTIRRIGRFVLRHNGNSAHGSPDAQADTPPVQ